MNKSKEEMTADERAQRKAYIRSKRARAQSQSSVSSLGPSWAGKKKSEMTDEEYAAAKAAYKARKAAQRSLRDHSLSPRPPSPRSTEPKTSQSPKRLESRQNKSSLNTTVRVPQVAEGAPDKYGGLSKEEYKAARKKQRREGRAEYGGLSKEEYKAARKEQRREGRVAERTTSREERRQDEGNSRGSVPRNKRASSRSKIGSERAKTRDTHESSYSDKDRHSRTTDGMSTSLKRRKRSKKGMTAQEYKIKKREHQARKRSRSRGMSIESSRSGWSTKSGRRRIYEAVGSPRHASESPRRSSRPSPSPAATPRASASGRRRATNDASRRVVDSDEEDSSGDVFYQAVSVLVPEDSSSEYD